ncbi:MULTISPECIES: cysteine rich repeat-containing protein [Lichenihabitans]|nr:MULTISPECIES: cysteine rich repeat-containing protein [Lichenihabitans]UDL93611.1 cysteine rich repeat-containing protein [Lichenihabitans sp. PAMC28606]
MTCLAAALAIASTTVAFADARGTKSQQDACQADVFKVCNDAVPDEKQIVECLNKNLAKLSFKCQLLIEPDPAKRTKEF